MDGARINFVRCVNTQLGPARSIRNGNPTAPARRLTAGWTGIWQVTEGAKANRRGIADLAGVLELCPWLGDLMRESNGQKLSSVCAMAFQSGSTYERVARDRRLTARPNP